MKMAVFHPDETTAMQYHDCVVAGHPELDVTATSDRADLEGLMPEVEILLAFKPPTTALAKAQSLRWIHCTSAGVDALMAAREHLSGVTITNFAGRPTVADHAICVLLMMHWNFPQMLDRQKDRDWTMFRTPPLEESTLGIIGLGSIGMDVARRAAGFSMNIVAMRRHPQPAPGISRVYGPNALNQMLPQCDFLVLTVPGTAETQSLIGKPELKMMKPTACLINVGRGGIVDETALATALENGELAGAALDVFETEPLPAEDPLWGVRNLIITPHLAGAVTRYVERVVETFSRNLACYKAGQPLPDAINKNLGY